jgi:hypothetical protein
MNLVSRPLGQPCSHLGMFVGGVVVDDQVDIQFRWEPGAARLKIDVPIEDSGSARWIRASRLCCLANPARSAVSN